jgi:hypothetical protein
MMEHRPQLVVVLLLLVLFHVGSRDDIYVYSIQRQWSLKYICIMWMYQLMIGTPASCKSWTGGLRKRREEIIIIEFSVVSSFAAEWCCVGFHA